MALAALIKTPALTIGWDTDPVDVSGGRRVLQKQTSNSAISWYAGRPDGSTFRVLTKDTGTNALAWRSSNDLTWSL